MVMAAVEFCEQHPHVNAIQPRSDHDQVSMSHLSCFLDRMELPAPGAHERKEMNTRYKIPTIVFRKEARAKHHTCAQVTKIRVPRKLGRVC